MAGSILNLESTKYALRLDNFEGPLDLLIFLIDKNKMNIYDIKISDITDQYIEYLNEQERLNLEIASEFLVMASTLILLKSKGLLPKEVDDEAELTEEELEDRGYNKSKNHVDLMIGTDDLNIVAKTYDGENLTIFENGSFTI